MKKAWIIIVGILVVIAAAVSYLLLWNNRGQPAATRQTIQNGVGGTTESSGNPDTQQPTPTPGIYTVYSPEAVANAAGRKILFFHAPWCPQCRALEKSITSGTIPPGVTIFKVDYDTATNLRQTYSVTIQTTLVEIDRSGHEVQKYVAYSSPALDTIINAMKLQ